MRLIINNKELRKAKGGWVRAKVALMSNEYLAYLDKNGIKIIGLEW